MFKLIPKKKYNQMLEHTESYEKALVNSDTCICELRKEKYDLEKYVQRLEEALNEEIGFKIKFKQKLKEVLESNKKEIDTTGKENKELKLDLKYANESFQLAHNELDDLKCIVSNLKHYNKALKETNRRLINNLYKPKIK